MAKKINISFKDTAADIVVYQEIISHTDKSAFVKEAIQFYMRSNITTRIPPVIPAKLSSNNKENREILNILG